jgi:hypothetical protein
MKDSLLPVFGNTCGKLYDDYILLASENNERTLPLNSVKKITFKSRIALSSLLFMVLPALFFVLPQFMENEDAFIKAFIYAIGILFIGVSIFKAEKKHSVNIVTKNQSVFKVRVISENIRDAKKFTQEANKLLIKNEAMLKSELSEQRTAETIFTTAGGVMAGSR